MGFSKQPPKKQKPLVLEKKTESAVFQVCGENERNVENALSWIQDVIEKEQSIYISEDECVKDFSEKEHQELKKLQENLTINICWCPGRSLIEVSGIGRDVEKARNAIEDMIKTIRLAKEKESRADYISEFIKWQYNDNNTFHSFDKITNLQLEDAKKERKRTVDVKINHQSYKVDLKACVATNAKGHSLPVQRLTLYEGQSNLHVVIHYFTLWAQNYFVHTSKLYSSR